MIGRLLVVGVVLLAWSMAFRRLGTFRPAVWRLSFGALAGLCAALVLLPGYLGVDAPSALPQGREWTAAALGAALGALWMRSSPSSLEDIRPWAEALGAAALAAALMMRFVAQPFRIPSGSMEDTLRAGDRVLVSKLPRGAASRGDVLAFRFPTEDETEIHCTGPQYGKGHLKRVVGVPGDVVEVRDAALFINGAPAAPEPYAKDLDPGACAKPPAGLAPSDYQRAWEERRLDRELGDGLRDHFGPIKVPEGSYLVLGDNRDASCDSRFWGPVPERYVLGEAFLVYWPPSRVGPIR